MRTLLKVLGILLLIPLCVLYMILVQTLALEHTVASTIGSAKVVQTEFDRSFKKGDLERLAAGLTDLLASGGSDGEATPTPEPTGGATEGTRFELDPAWFATNARTAVLGMHAYFTGSAKHLPTLEVGTLLVGLQEALVAGIVVEAGSGADAELSALAKTIRLLPDGGLVDGEPSAEALALVGGNENLKALELGDAVTIAVVKELLAADDPDPKVTLTKRILRIVVADRLKLGDASKELSLDLLVSNVFGTDDNIVRVGRDKGLDIAATATRALLVFLLLLVLLMALLSFSPRTTPLWLGIPLVLAGGSTLLTALLNATFQSGISGQLDKMLNPGRLDPGASSLDLASLRSFFLALFNRLTRQSLVDGLLLFVAGILLVVLSIVFFSVQRRRRQAATSASGSGTPVPYGPGLDSGMDPTRKASQRYWILFLVRTVLVALVVFAMGFTGRVAAWRIEQDLDAIRSAVSEPKTSNLFQIVDETLGTHFAELAPDLSPTPSPKPTPGT